MPNIFEVNSKNTRATSGASIVNFEHILNCILVAEFQQKNAGWAWESVVSDKKIVFSNCEKYIVLWARKVCWAICFHLYSPNISLQKDKFSQQHFKIKPCKANKIIGQRKALYRQRNQSLAVWEKKLLTLTSVKLLGMITKKSCNLSE